MRACSYIADLPVRPYNNVILSDSKSALQAIANKTKNRTNIHNEIRFLGHTLLSSGVNIEFFWIQGHVGIGGNDLADATVKEYTHYSEVSLNIRLSMKLDNNKVERIIWEQRNNDLVRLAESKGWIAFTTELTNCFTGFKENFRKTKNR